MPFRPWHQGQKGEDFPLKVVPYNPHLPREDWASATRFAGKTLSTSGFAHYAEGVVRIGMTNAGVLQGRIPFSGKLPKECNPASPSLRDRGSERAGGVRLTIRKSVAPTPALSLFSFSKGQPSPAGNSEELPGGG